MPSVAEQIVASLRDAGVRFLFGMPGGGSNLDLVDAAGRAGLPFVLTATETAGALAALAQAEITGRPGACLTTLGPGVASVVNGVACARLERAPLMVFTDSHPDAGRDTFEHQRLDHRALLAPVTKWSAAISAENVDEVMRDAVAHSMAQPRGPVHVECPGDVLSRSVGARAFQASDPARFVDGDPERVALRPISNEILAAARRPLLLLGLGARAVADAAAIRALCASHNLPAVVTYKAKGVVPDEDSHFAGLLTNGAIERTILEQADLFIAVGLDPVELIPRPWTHPQPIFNVDDDIAGRVTSIGARLPASAWDLEWVRRTVAQQRQAVCPPSAGLAPHRVVQVVADAAAARARVTVDAGAHMFPATMLWPVSEPNGMLISNGLSTMGFALPAAIGAALLERGSAEAGDDQSKPVVALTGDGGLLMCIGELLTAVRERLHVIVVVFNDASLSLIDIKQRQRKLASSGVEIGNVKWCALAASLGVNADVAASEDQLASALRRGLAHNGPSLIEARIDPGTYGETLRAIRG
jgi:acetolactate synthase-1/2/3 large subunit